MSKNGNSRKPIYFERNNQPIGGKRKPIKENSRNDEIFFDDFEDDKQPKYEFEE